MLSRFYYLGIALILLKCMDSIRKTSRIEVLWLFYLRGGYIVWFSGPFPRKGVVGWLEQEVDVICFSHARLNVLMVGLTT